MEVPGVRRHPVAANLLTYVCDAPAEDSDLEKRKTEGSVVHVAAYDEALTPPKKKAPAATNLEVALLLLQKEGSTGVACRMEGTLTEVSAGQTGSNMLCNLHAEITPLQLKASEYPEDPLEQRNLSVTYSSTVTSVGSVRVFIAFSTQPRLCRQKIKLQLDAPVINPSGLSALRITKGAPNKK